MRPPADYTVVYDGDCAVCLRFVDFVRRRDPAGAIELVAYQEEGVPERFSWIDPARFEEALQLVGPGAVDPGSGFPRDAGTDTPDASASGCRAPGPDASPHATWEGALAVERLLRVLPRGPRLGWVFRVPFARPLFAWGYRSFARNRRRFGCGKHCAPEVVGD